MRRTKPEHEGLGNCQAHDRAAAILARCLGGVGHVRRHVAAVPLASTEGEQGTADVFTRPVRLGRHCALHGVLCRLAASSADSLTAAAAYPHRCLGRPCRINRALQPGPNTAQRFRDARGKCLDLNSDVPGALERGIRERVGSHTFVLAHAKRRRACGGVGGNRVARRLQARLGLVLRGRAGAGDVRRDRLDGSARKPPRASSGALIGEPRHQPSSAPAGHRPFRLSLRRSWRPARRRAGSPRSRTASSWRRWSRARAAGPRAACCSSMRVSRSRATMSGRSWMKMTRRRMPRMSRSGRCRSPRRSSASARPAPRSARAGRAWQRARRG